MGGAASIEQAHTLNIDYATLRSAGINFSTAFDELDARVRSAQQQQQQQQHPPPSSSAGDGDHSGEMTLHFLAIRQLSQNLRYQDTLERSRRKVLKSRSLPNNLRYKEDADLSLDAECDEKESEGETRDEFEQADLDLIHDLDFSVPVQTHAHPPHSTHTHTHAEEKASEQGKEESKPEAKKKKNKPVLALQLSDHDSAAELLPPSHAPAPLLGAGVGVGGKGESFMTRVSPRGTLYMGQLKINEKGIFPDDSAPNSPLKLFAEKRVFLCDTALINGSFHLRPAPAENESHSSVVGPGLHASERDSETETDAPLSAMGGKDDFVEIATLGSGASGVVAEAVHVPSLTIVALKMLPVYNQEKRQHVSRELRVLYKNLAEMRLIDESLTVNADNTHAGLLSPASHKQTNPNGGREKCPNVLSLYNAFVDPKSGMINLAVEYMDGGSLEDLVKQGGCADERVLADISFQTLNGLAFLHRNKNIHRDIKPANILCSSSGLIKIADFGISKALDHTTGFANSFVGTVCYMSPERISGENYSFSCDIWSLGLTILAVARGRFPISASAGSDSSDAEQVIGGPGGYWAMMKAICDDDPPVAGSKFSGNFNEFIAACLHKDPAQRSTAKELLESRFVSENRHPDDSEESYPDTEEELNAQIQRLTGFAIQRSVTSTAANSEVNSARGSGRKDKERLGEQEQRSNLDIIYSIRLEHLDRVLEKLAAVLKRNSASVTPPMARIKSDISLCEDKASLSPSPFDQSFRPQKNLNKSSFFDNSPSQKSHTNKSVHFEDKPEPMLSSLAQHESQRVEMKNKPNLKLNLLDVGDDEEIAAAQEEEPFDPTLSLPKTSSYFAATKFEAHPFTTHRPLEHRNDDRNNKKVDYGSMLPRFDNSGILQWKLLAHQLHLPLPIVLIAARSKLGSLVDLDN